MAYAYAKSIPTHLHIAALLHKDWTVVDKIVKAVNESTGEYALYTNGRYQLLTELMAFGGKVCSENYTTKLGKDLWTKEVSEEFKRMLNIMGEPQGYLSVINAFPDLKNAHSRYRDIVALLTNLAIEAGLRDNSYDTVRNGWVASYAGDIVFDAPYLGRIRAVGYSASGSAAVINAYGYVSFTRT